MSMHGKKKTVQLPKRMDIKVGLNILTHINLKRKKKEKYVELPKRMDIKVG